MHNELNQSVIDVFSRPHNAAGVSAAAISTGLSTALNIIPPVIGILTSIAGFILACMLIVNGYKKGKLIDMEIKNKENELRLKSK